MGKPEYLAKKQIDSVRSLLKKRIRIKTKNKLFKDFAAIKAQRERERNGDPAPHPHCLLLF